jgi:hypothetical protein
MTDDVLQFFRLLMTIHQGIGEVMTKIELGL